MFCQSRFKEGLNSYILLRKWLCLSDTKPLFLYDKLCWRSYFAPQLHIFGKRDNGDLYRIFMRSQNSCFDKLYPFSFSGRVESHIDAPFSWLILFKQILLVGKFIIKLWSISVLRCIFSSLILYFNLTIHLYRCYIRLFVLNVVLSKIRWCFLNFIFLFSQYQRK